MVEISILLYFAEGTDLVPPDADDRAYPGIRRWPARVAAMPYHIPIDAPTAAVG